MGEGVFDAVILAGGEGRRLGGADKALLEVGGRSLLERVLAAVSGAGRVVVVGPRRAGIEGVTWCQEDPPGGGPVAAIGAALPHTASPYLCLLAADLPFVTKAVINRLVSAADRRDGALLVDSRGRDQLLCAVFSRSALAKRLTGRPLPGRPLRSLVEALDLARLPDETGSAVDCDTWDDLAAARTRARRTEAQRAR
jgi:molybdopterin-guanine dinucleotide biosynthesis protein A